MTTVKVASALMALMMVAATPLAAQSTDTTNGGTTVPQTGNQVSNGGAGSGTGTVEPGKMPSDNSKSPEQTGVNKGQGSGTGTMQPAGTN